MNYFRCTVGGSGKGNTVTVTCAEEFAGLTITLAKTGKTYTKTCPSTSPYVVTFYGVENGTYTVSCTVDGQTYSETIIVQDISCVLNYGFSWKLWVDTASQLDSSDYDTLDEVLADEKALRELFLEHACVDYMAEATSSNEDLETIINDDYCAKWINLSDYALDYLYANEVIADLMDEADKYFYGEWVITDNTTTPPTWGPKGNVPVMTSNTAPYGEAIADSNVSSNAKYMAFDGNSSTEWDSNIVGTTAGAWIGYKFTNPVNVRRFHHIASGAQTVTFKLGYSDNGSTWTDLDTVYSNSGSDTDGITEDIADNGYHLYWRIYKISSDSNNRLATKILQFYGRELKVSVPTMTSSTAPFGTVSGNGSGGYTSWHAFGSSGYAWNNDSLSAIYDFGKAVVVKAFDIASYNYSTHNYKIIGSNDGENYEDVLADVKTVIPSLSNQTVGHGNVENNKAYRYYGFTVGNSDNYLYPKCNFYGLDYSEKEFEAGTTKKWLYDHGVELESISPAITTGGTITEGNDFITLDRTNGSANLSIATDSTIDISSYTKYFSIVDTTKTSETERITIASSRTSSVSAATASKVVSMVGGNVKDCLDISAINQSLYPIIIANTVGSFNVKELWLE